MKNRRRLEAKHAFTDAECSRLRHHLSRENDDFQAIFELGINSSFFYSELSQLTRKDLQNILSLNRTNQHNLLEYTFKGRLIYLSASVKKAIQKFLNKTSHRHTDSIAFRTVSGNKFREDSISHYLEYWCDVSRCERGSLRKTFFVNLYRSGVPIINLQYYLRIPQREKVLKYFNIDTTTAKQLTLPTIKKLPLHKPNLIHPHTKCCGKHTEEMKKLQEENRKLREELSKKESELKFLKRNFKVLLEHFAALEN